MKRIFNLFPVLYKKFLGYLARSKLSYFWNDGSLTLLGLKIQILIAFCLSWYIPQISLLFLSVALVMRGIPTSWVTCSAYADGSSFFFFVYVYMGISVYYGSSQALRILVWLSGLAVFFFMILTAFLGYGLSWGRMFYWVLAVIISLITVVVFFGNISLSIRWGVFGLCQQTLTRFYSFHVFLVSVFRIFFYRFKNVDNNVNR